MNQLRVRHSRRTLPHGISIGGNNEIKNPHDRIPAMPNSLVFPATTPNPASPNHPARDEYHGVEVMDQYRWLEDGNDPP